MAWYFAASTPLVIVFGTVIVLAIPYLAVIALLLVAFGVLVALARAIVSLTRLSSRAASRGRHRRSGFDRLQERPIEA